MTRLALIMCGCLALASAADAHRLDEYLQATRIDIARDRITVEIDLTPGVSVAPQVLAAIDIDRDGSISSDEADAYVAEVLSSLSLTVDGRVMSLERVDSRIPDMEAMNEGLGTIRVTAHAQTGAGARGPHHLIFRNRHRPDIGVYLANALVPHDRAIEIDSQHRDPQQRELRIDYRVESRWAWPLSLSGAAVLTMAGLVGLRRRRGTVIRKQAKRALITCLRGRARRRAVPGRVRI